jgi:hypothetical protein
MLKDLFVSAHELRIAYHTQEEEETILMLFPIDLIQEIVAISSEIEHESSLDMFINRQLEDVSDLMTRIEENIIRSKLEGYNTEILELKNRLKNMNKKKHS